VLRETIATIDSEPVVVVNAYCNCIRTDPNAAEYIRNLGYEDRVHAERITVAIVRILQISPTNMPRAV
jgi:hypothetical protein